ncbi:MAG: hypothetical protein IPK58_03760 [Acidobacteria bacterium]|nr:hypothetical protein [Acidobacteriota bacterium]
MQFAWGALWSALCVLGILHVINPNEFIVQSNIALMREGGRSTCNTIPI